jgi:hypothetical protein
MTSFRADRSSSMATARTVVSHDLFERFAEAAKKKA